MAETTDLNVLAEMFFQTNNRYEAWEILEYMDGIVECGTPVLLGRTQDLDETAKIAFARDLVLKLMRALDDEYRQDEEDEDE